jgi:hypothetical protein
MLTHTDDARPIQHECGTTAALSSTPSLAASIACGAVVPPRNPAAIETHSDPLPKQSFPEHNVVRFLTHPAFAYALAPAT